MLRGESVPTSQDSQALQEKLVGIIHELEAYSHQLAALDPEARRQLRETAERHFASFSGEQKEAFSRLLDELLPA
jgi:hypothetical protein